MKKTNALNLLAGLFLILALFYLASCEKVAIEPTIENSEVTQSYLQQVAQDNSGLLSATEKQLDETEGAFRTKSSSEKKLAVSIKSSICPDGKHRTLVAVKSKDPSFHFDEHKEYQLYWLRGKEKTMLAKNSKLNCVCGDKFTVVVWHKKSITRTSTTVKVTCPIIFEPQGPGKTEVGKS